jgi:hypothetical protein
MSQLVRIRDPAKRRGTYTDDSEPLFQNDLLGRILAAVNGDTRLVRRLGIPCATSRRWHDKHLLHPKWRPWVNPRKGANRKLSAEDCQLIRDHLFRDPRMRNREVTAPDILSVLWDLWAGMGHEEPFPQMSLQTVRRMLSRWGWS